MLPPETLSQVKDILSITLSLLGLTAIALPVFRPIRRKIKSFLSDMFTGEVTAKLSQYIEEHHEQAEGRDAAIAQLALIEAEHSKEMAQLRRAHTKTLRQLSFVVKELQRLWEKSPPNGKE